MNMTVENGISMSKLKLIACISMLIDHLAVCLSPILLKNGDIPELLYNICRFLGRPAFIIFAFCVTETLFRTRSKSKYLVRLGIFAVITEIFFDFFKFWQFSATCFGYHFFRDFFEYGFGLSYIRQIVYECLSCQNVLFLYFIAFASIWAIETVKKKYFGIMNSAYYFFSILIMAAATMLVIFIRPDYGVTGLYCVYVFYLTRGNNRLTVIGMFIWSIFAAFEGMEIEWFGLLALIPILKLYNGEKGKMSKWFFYIFFPAHLFILSVVRYFIVYPPF